MINYTEIAMSEFSKAVDEVFSSNNITKAEVISIVKQMSRISFSRFSKSDSLYFSLDHVLNSGKIGLEIIYSIMSKNGTVRDGTIINLMASILFCNIGIIKGVLPTDQIGRYLTSEDNYLKSSNDGTGSELWKYKKFRSKSFLQSSAYLTAILNEEILSDAIDCSDIFEQNEDKKTNYGMVQQYSRAAQVITLMSSSNYRRSITELFYSAEEGGVLDAVLCTSIGDFRQKFPQFFWNTLFPDIAETVLVLRETDRGRDIISQVYAHL